MVPTPVLKDLGTVNGIDRSVYFMRFPLLADHGFLFDWLMQLFVFHWNFLMRTGLVLLLEMPERVHQRFYPRNKDVRMIKMAPNE